MLVHAFTTALLELYYYYSFHFTDEETEDVVIKDHQWWNQDPNQVFLTPKPMLCSEFYASSQFYASSLVFSI